MFCLCAGGAILLLYLCDRNWSSRPKPKAFKGSKAAKKASRARR